MTPARPALLAAAALLLLACLGAAAALAPAPVPTDAPRALMEPALHRPASFLGEAQSGPPTGLPVPTIQDGIGPGSGLHQHEQAGEADGGFLCTGAFLLRDPATAAYYLATAGHCLVRNVADPTPYTGLANPDKVDQEVDVCVQGCLDNALGLGTYVRLVAGGGYAPVAYGESGGPGQDFGLIAIPPEHHGLLRPWMPQFGGPTGASATTSGDTLVHYGHGSYCCPVAGGAASRTPVDQGRVGLSLGPTSLFGATGGGFSAIGSSSGGDSGAGVAIGLASPTRGLRGAAAVGVLTHGVAVEGVPYFEGTTLAHGLDMVRAATGLELQLVLEGDPLTAVADPALAAAPRIAIRDPGPGATVRPGGDGTTLIQGSAGRGNQTPAPGSLVQLAVDDAAFAPASRVPVLGNATWSAAWDLHGVPLGPHVLYARLLSPDGRQLAAVNHTVTVAARGAAGSGTPATPHAPGGTGTPPDANSSTTAARRTPLPALLPVLGLAAAAAALRRKR